MTCKIQEWVSRQTYTHATISMHNFASSFPLAAVYGRDNSRKQGLTYHYDSSPRAIACSRATFFSRQNATRGGFQKARISPVREGAATEFVPINLYPCTDRGQSKELFCLVQAKGCAVLRNPPYFTLCIVLFACFCVVE